MESHPGLDKRSTLKAFGQLLVIMKELREKCPWDQKQTMESLRHLTIEETFELSEAILAGNMEDIKEELGDLLLHIIFYARIASEQRSFTLTQVIQTLCEKLIYRHPHIYDQEKVEDTQAVKQNWERLKLQEKENRSVLGGVPYTLSSLIKAMRIQEKASMIGFGWNKKEEVWKKVQQAMQELVCKISQTTPNSSKLEDAFGDVLFTLVHYAGCISINAESALEKANKRFIQSFQHLEQQIAKQGKQITQLSTEELMRRWKEAKQQAFST